MVLTCSEHLLGVSVVSHEHHMSGLVDLRVVDHPTNQDVQQDLTIQRGNRKKHRTYQRYIAWCLCLPSPFIVARKPCRHVNMQCNNLHKSQTAEKSKHNRTTSEARSNLETCRHTQQQQHLMSGYTWGVSIAYLAPINRSTSSHHYLVGKDS